MVKSCYACIHEKVCYAMGRMPERAETCSCYLPNNEFGSILKFVEYLKAHACSYDLEHYHPFKGIDIEYLDDNAKEFLENNL